MAIGVFYRLLQHLIKLCNDVDLDIHGDISKQLHAYIYKYICVCVYKQNIYRLRVFLCTDIKYHIHIR